MTTQTNAYILTTTPTDCVNWRRFTHMGIIEIWDGDKMVFAERHLATSYEAAHDKLHEALSSRQ